MNFSLLNFIVSRILKYIRFIVLHVLFSEHYIELNIHNFQNILLQSSEIWFMAVLLSNDSSSVDQIVGFSMCLGFYFSDFIGAVTIYYPIQQIFVSSSRTTNVSVSGDFRQDPPWVISVHLSDFCCYTNFCCSLTFDKESGMDYCTTLITDMASCLSICPNTLLLTLTQQCHL